MSDNDLRQIEGALGTSNAAAAIILAQLVSGRLDRGEPLSPRLLQWYVSHRKVELLLEGELADSPFAREADVDSVEKDIARAEAALRLALS